MFRQKFILRNEASADGADGGGGGGGVDVNAVTPSRWSVPDSAENHVDAAPAPEAPPAIDAPIIQGDPASIAPTDAPVIPEGDAPVDPAPVAPTDAQFNMDELPPFIRDAIKAHKSGTFNQDDFVDKYKGMGDIETAPSENVIREYYSRKYGIKSEENPNGVTQEEINSYIKSQKEKDLLDFTAREFRPQLQNLIDAERTEVYDRDYQKFADSQEKNLEELFVKTANYDNIYGVKVGKSDIESFNQELKGFLLPEKGEQLQPLYVTEKLSNLLSNDETLYQMLYAATKSPQIKEALNGAKESTKRNIESKLGLTPNVGGGSPSAHNSGVVTPALWAMPEQ